MIGQKAQIKAHQESLEAYAAEEQLEREKARADARNRVLQDFERGLGLGGVKIGGAKPKVGTEKKVELGRDPSKNDVSVKLIEGPAGDERGVKRKFELDESAVEKVAREAEDAAMKAIEAEQVSLKTASCVPETLIHFHQAESRRAKLPSFWLPTLTPEATIGPLKDVKLQTMCNVGEHPHPLALKNLLPVHFTYPAASKTDTTQSTPICPSCSREISNATRSILLTSRRPAQEESTDGPGPAKKAKKDKKEKEELVCGHVVCSTCADTIVKPGKQCPVCEAHVRPDKDLIELGREGKHTHHNQRVRWES